MNPADPNSEHETRDDREGGERLWTGWARCFEPGARHPHGAADSLARRRAHPHPIRVHGPTLAIGDHILVTKYSYGMRWPITRIPMTDLRRRTEAT